MLVKRLSILCFIFFQLCLYHIGSAQINSIFETRVGIGRTPSAKLDINSASGEDALRVRVDGATILRVLANKGTTIGSNPGSAPVNGLYVSGNTGFGTTTASEKVVINGALNLKGNASSDTPDQGTIRWNDATSDFEGYDGTQWKSLTGDPNPNQTTYAVGDRAQGGIVFWVTPDGKHGKVIHLHAMQSASGEVIGRWSNIQDEGSGARSPTEGNLNTIDIINQEGHVESAAKACDELIADGYDDWYLPANNEIILIKTNLSLINNQLFDWGGLPFGNTWTSTEQNADDAWWFNSIENLATEKSTPKNFRAIRSF